MVSIQRDTVSNASPKATTNGRSVTASAGAASRLPARPRATCMFISLVMVWCLACLGLTIRPAESFQMPTTTSTRTELPPGSANLDSPLQGSYCSRNPATSTQLHLFGREKKNRDENKSSSSSINESESGEPEKKRPKIPFLGLLKRRRDKDADTVDADTVDADSEQQQQEETPSVVATATEVGSPPEVKRRKKKKESLSPGDLKVMAERARLEADRMDAELTLSKIEKLEKTLVQSKKRDDSDTSVVVDDLQEQLDALQAKLRGDPPAKKGAATSTNATPKDSSTQTNTETTKPSVLAILAEVDDAKVLENAAIIAENEVEFFSDIRTADELELAPEFILKLLAPFYGMKSGDDGKIDKVELVKRWNMAKNLDYSFFEKDPPSFQRDDILKKKTEIIECDKKKLSGNGLYEGSTANDLSLLSVTKMMMEKADGNATQLALYSLEYDYYLSQGADEFVDFGAEFVEGLFQNASYFSAMYPKCVAAREDIKGDDYVSEEPTEAQIEIIAKTILPAIKYSSNAKPLKVPGGYAITGTHKFENGDLLLEAIDKEIAKSRPNLKDQITVLYTPSYGPLDENIYGRSVEDMTKMDDQKLMAETLEMFAETEPILYITGPNIVRDSNRAGLTLTSILGLATAWYLSVYPFLLNDQIAGRIDADLQLLEGNLQPDMSYLTDLSLPLFLTFMGLQLVHEAAHWLTATSKGVKLSVPVFVPSLISGITSTVTTFKTLPKNKNDMFDISAAGPLAGVVFSCVALAFGAKLTMVSDPATLPALPLEILRQSTLGGAIIEQIIPGSLYVPDGAPTGGITIPLHPIGIAGYVALIVNALALLPIGTTDGGRLTMALFDRAEKLSIGTLTLIAIFTAGFFGSDLFLFYFSFCLAFQTGNEVPARNEQDSVEFSRVIVALVCYGLAILTLVPVQ